MKIKVFYLGRHIKILILVYCVLVVGRITHESLTGFLKHLPKNVAAFSSKVVKKKDHQNLFPAILRQKNGPLKKDFFYLRLP